MTFFAQPSALLILLALPALWLLMRQAAAQGQESLRRFGDPELLARSSALPSRPAGAAVVLRWLGFACLILALARPQFGRQPVALAKTGRDLVVALDLSRSMLAADVGDTRLNRARELAWQLASAHPGDRVGLVIFGGAAFLQLPPTTDLGTLRLFLDAASPDDIADPATDVAAGLRVAERALRKERSAIGSRAVILLSDGERSEGSLDDVLGLYRRVRLPVFAVGVGTLAGSRVPADSGSPSGPWHLDGIGRQIVSRLAEPDLQRIAQSSNGEYARWDDADRVKQVGAALANLEARTLGTQPLTEPNERYQWPLAVGVVVLLVEMVLGRRQAVPLPAIPPSRRPAWYLVLLPALFSCGPERDVVRGQQLYESGKYLEAYEAYQRVLRQQGGPEVRYNSANALYRLRQYPEAAKTWREALGAADGLRQRAYFNMGNAYVRAAEDANALSRYLDRAIEVYEEALKLDPSDKDAKWNLELALRRRGDTGEDGSRGRGGRADYGRGNMREEGYEANRQTAVGAMAGGGQGGDEGESVEELDEQQARALLESIERQQLSTHEGRRQQRGGGANRDW